MRNVSSTTGQSGSITELLSVSERIEMDFALKLHIGAVRHGASVRVRRRAATVWETFRRWPLAV